MSGLNSVAVTEAEFDARARDLSLPSPLAIAVSGGPDSMALALLVLQWTQRNSLPPPTVFIVDHALRTESGIEAAGVKTRLETLGMRVEILRWDHALVTSSLHDQARRARYKLLLGACHRHTIGALLFAHQREDQAETILMRLARGSGIDGLAGMSPDSIMQGVRILRPLLDIPKSRLVATCDAAAIVYVSDPSNEAEIYARGRLRRVMPLLEHEGLTIDRLIDCGRRAAEARDALDHYTHQFLGSHTQRKDCGTLSVDKTALLALPRAVAARALSCSLGDIHRGDYAPQYAALSRLLDAAGAEPILRPCTLNGCLIRQNRGQLVISREYAAITERLTISGGEALAWDGRWRVTLAPDAGRFMVRALGNPPHAVLDALAPGLRRKIPQGRVRAALPSLWRDEAPVLVPFPGSESVATARLNRVWPPSIF